MDSEPDRIVESPIAVKTAPPSRAISKVPLRPDDGRQTGVRWLVGPDDRNPRVEAYGSPDPVDVLSEAQVDQFLTMGRRA